MTSGQLERLAVVRALLQFNRSLSDIKSELASFNWDHDGEQVILTRELVISTLQRYVDGNISSSDVECWANLIEGREDVIFDGGFEEVIGGVLHELANPELEQLLDMSHAKTLIGKLMLM